VIVSLYARLVVLLSERLVDSQLEDKDPGVHTMIVRTCM